MPCQTVNSQSQVQSRLPTLPQSLPQTQPDWNAFLATLNQWGSILQQASHAPNVIPTQFQTFTPAAAAAVIAALSATSCTPSVDNSQQFYGGASLKTVIGATGAVLAFAGFPISIAGGSRWFCSFQIQAPSGCTASLTVATSAGHSVTESFTVPASPGWQQVWGLFDLRQWPDTQARWIFTFTSTATVWLDGMQMNAVGSPIGVLPKFAGTQMVLGGIAYASNLDGVPDGATYGRFLNTGLTGNIANTNGLVPNSATSIQQNIVNNPVTPASFGLGNISVNDIAFTPSVNCTVEITAILDCQIASGPDSGQSFNIYLDPAWPGTGFISGSASFGNNSATNTVRSGVAISASFSVTAGTTYHCGACSKNSVGAGSNNKVWYSQVVQELIQR